MGSIRSWFKRLLSYDHRQGERLEAPLLVAYYWDGSIPTAHKIRDISSTGFYLLTTERWHLGTIVTMTLQRSDTGTVNPSGEHYVSVQSKVVRLGEDGVGFAFIPVESKRSDVAQTSKRVQTSKNKVADKQALRKFLDHLKLDDGYVMIGLDRGVEKETLLGQDGSLRMPGENVMNRLKDESGQSLVVAALAMTCLMGFVALAADVGVMSRERRLVQTAADSGAIAGASELGFADVTAAARADATKNGFTDGTNGATVVVNIGPATGPHAGNTNYIEVIVSRSEPTFFMRVFGRSAMTVAARAVASKGGAGGCVYTLSPTGASNPNLSGADFYIAGSANISAPTCGIIDNSNSSKALSINGSVVLTAKSIGVVGGYSPSGSIVVNPTPITGIAPTSDPLASLPQPSVSPPCPATSRTGSTNTTLNPGCFGGLTIGGSAIVHLNPGLYVINGSLDISGSTTITGTGVTLYITGGGAVNLHGSESMTLTAPTTGTYNGILFFQDRSDSSPFNFTGSAIMNLQGIFYFPNSDVTFAGSVSGSIYTDFVTKTFSDTGSVVWHDYATLTSNSPLTSVGLVE